MGKWELPFQVYLWFYMFFPMNKLIIQKYSIEWKVQKQHYEKIRKIPGKFLKIRKNKRKFDKYFLLTRDNPKNDKWIRRTIERKV